jgi:3D (Asp-Asp-Asp) domain-containing protein
VPLVLVDGGLKQTVRSSAATVGQLLEEQHLALRAHDQVFPAPDAYLAPNEVVRVDRVDAWTDRVKQRLAPHVQERFDARLPAGTTKTVARGSSGVRVATVRYERRNDEPLTKRVLGYEILQAPSPRIVVHGSRPYSALSDIAAQGFSGALRFAGAALHVIATAYTSSCYGCSGFTASGARAGLGIIAVDPRVIPLGTHLFIPGYGRAVAGDTGGAIVGHRIDLGFENVASAMRFGSREVTVYVVK